MTKYITENRIIPTEKEWNSFAIKNNYLTGPSISYASGTKFPELCKKIYKEAKQKSKNPVCYNGDIFSKEVYQEWRQYFPDEDAVMIGRGILFSPDVLGKIKEDRHYKKEIYRQFHNALLEGYLLTIQGEQNAIFKMKELWNYVFHGMNNPDSALLQKIRHSMSLTSYLASVEMVFAQVNYE